MDVDFNVNDLSVEDMKLIFGERYKAANYNYKNVEVEN